MNKKVSCYLNLSLISESKDVADELDVSLLGIFLRHALLLAPGIPLGLSLEVKHAWSVGVHVSHQPLFVKTVNFKFLLVGEGF